MKENKTVFEWLSSIVDSEIRESALYNLDKYGSTKARNSVVSNLGDAIDNAFFWGDTRQGRGYWAQIMDDADKGRIKMDYSIDFDY